MDSSLDSKQESEFALIPMDRKRDRSPSADESTTKMCLILGATIQPDFVMDYVYAMILDPNLQTDADTTFDEDDFILNPQPTVRFDGLNGDLAAFCVSKSTLYIFESLHRSPSRVFYDNYLLSVDHHHHLDFEARRAMIAEIPVTKSVYSFDLALADSSMVVVQKSELQKVPDMWGAKIDAAALLTPQGKVLVYSTIIGSDFTLHPGLSEFEIYDPDTQVWIQLPPLYNHPPCACNYSSTMFIVGSGFLSSSVFYISTSRGNYVIDVEENEKCWKKHELRFPRDVSDQFYYAGVEGMCLTNFDVKSSKDWGSLCQYPDLSIYPEYIYEYLSIRQFDFNGIDRLIALVDNVDGGGCFSFCSVQSTFYRDVARDPPGPGIPFIMMDVFRANSKLIIPNEGVDKKLIISKKGCLKFSPRQLGNISRLFGLGLFTVQFRSFEGSETF